MLIICELAWKKNLRLEISAFFLLSVWAFLSSGAYPAPALRTAVVSMTYRQSVPREYNGMTMKIQSC